MAQITIDMANPKDVQFMQSLLDAGLMDHFLKHGDGDVDVVAAVDALLSAVGDDARDLLQEFMVQTEDGPTTLEAVAKALDVDYDTAKARKLNMGRSVKKVQKAFPGMPDPVRSKWDASEKKMNYTMDDDIRSAIDNWFVEHGYVDTEETTP